MNTRFQIAIVVLLSLILAAIVIPAALTYWQTRRSTMAVSPEPVLTVFQNKLVLEGYLRDHATHRWYRGSEAAAHGCRVTGTVADASFNNCQLPLTGGIPDHE
jgi:hypothetical protein